MAKKLRFHEGIKEIHTHLFIMYGQTEREMYVVVRLPQDALSSDYSYF